MKQDQEFTPKYWIGHHKESDDVLLFTAAKTRSVCCDTLEKTYSEDWFMDDNFEVSLFEIKLVGDV